MSRNRRRRKAGGFTLLEVLLALAILVGALATIGVLQQQGLQSGHDAAALAKAQMYCESKLAEITSGITTPASVQNATLEADPEWLYSIVVEPTTDSSLLAVSVTVAENRPAPSRPVGFTLVRWMVDPQAATDAAADAATAEQESL